MLAMDFQNDALADTVQRALDGVGQRFNAELASDLDCVNELAEYVERYRGKMLRPTLVTLAALAVRGDLDDPGDEVLTVATVCEMVHMATLVHDDILDEAELRRRGATVNHLHGNEAAVMLGDYLISHAYHLCSSLGDQSISRQIAATTNTVCEGELLQLSHRNHWGLNERTYFEIVRRKTAALTEACCSLGAELAGGTPEQVQALATYGGLLGVAFQIVDDLLDLTGDPDRVGKSLHRDVAKGKLTLPMIRHLQTAPASDRDAAHAIIERFAAADLAADPGTDASPSNAPTGADVEPLVDLLLTGDALPYARNTAASLVASAQEQLAVLPDSPARELLGHMAQAVTRRDR